MGASAGIMMGASALTQGISSASAAQAQGSFQRQQAETNAELANQQANDAEHRGATEANLQEKKARTLQGNQRAALASSGVDINSGSAAVEQQDTQVMGHLDALTIKNNAVREAWGYRSQAQNYATQGRMDELTANNQARNSLLTGGMKAAGSFADAGDRYARNSTTTKTTSSPGGAYRNRAETYD